MKMKKKRKKKKEKKGSVLMQVLVVVDRTNALLSITLTTHNTHRCS